MGAPKRSDVDWPRIHRLYTEGVTPYSIANMLKAEGVKLSKQAIMQRAEREGWVKPGTRKPAPKPTAKPQAAPESTKTETDSPASLPAPATTGTTLTLEAPPEQKEVIRRIAEVGVCRHAALACGVDEETFEEWLLDPVFKKQARVAIGTFASKHMDNIAQAADRGEWRAAEALLKLSPDTRDDFGEKDRGGKGGIVVNLKFDLVRGAIPREEDIITLEHEPGR